MMKSCLWIICSMLSWQALAENTEQEVGQYQDRVLGQSFLFSSPALGADRLVEIYKPESYDNTQKKYPVIYVMDSGFLFDLTVSLLRNRWSRDLAPESIIVGIQSRDNSERFDFAMPMKRDDGSFSFADSQPQLMARFLSQELEGYIRNNFRTNNFKVLIGMSPTATNVIYDYLADDSFFDAHIAIAADLHFKTADDKPLHLAIKEKAESSASSFIFLSRGSTDLINNPAVGVPYRLLNGLPDKDELGIYAFLPEQTEHYSVAAMSIDQAFAHLFPMELWRPDYRHLRDSEDSVPYLESFYSQLDKEVGYETYPIIDGYWMGRSILGLARSLGRNDKLTQAEAVLLWANERIPNDIWINYYLSRTNVRLNELEKALKYAKISVSIAKKIQDPDLSVVQENLDTLSENL